MVDFKKQGAKNRKSGAKFELKVRKHFEELNWIVSKWQNNIDLQDDSIIMAKRHYIPGKGLTMGKGFPDFVLFKKDHHNSHYSLQFVECKKAKYLSKEEKQKMQVLVDKGHRCLIAFDDDGDVALREFEGYEE